tara:strand:+ start:3779 stop:3997 length:219 start_codon:yes stop_codon:yes gene_type:complete
MNRVPVVSSNVAEVGYNPETKTLEVAFIKGGVYQYLGVPLSVYKGLLAAPSVGRYLDVNVKKAGYSVRKVDS